jgi:hypothetical protein
MKMNLYYLVRRYKGGIDSIGRDADCACVDGPFYCWNDAYQAKKDMKMFQDDYEVVKQSVEVQE